MSADHATALANAIAFNDNDLPDWLAQASDADLDTLNFGTLGIDAAGAVCRYNRFESAAAGLSPARVIGHPLFTVVAPCMNNFLVAQRFEDAVASGSPLDATIDYVLTLRMRPVKVKLRLLANPGASVRWVLVQRPV